MRFHPGTALVLSAAALARVGPSQSSARSAVSAPCTPRTPTTPYLHVPQERQASVSPGEGSRIEHRGTTRVKYSTNPEINGDEQPKRMETEFHSKNMMSITNLLCESRELFHAENKRPRPPPYEAATVYDWPSIAVPAHIKLPCFSTVSRRSVPNNTINKASRDFAHAQDTPETSKLRDDCIDLDRQRTSEFKPLMMAKPKSASSCDSAISWEDPTSASSETHPEFYPMPLAQRARAWTMTARNMPASNESRTATKSASAAVDASAVSLQDSNPPASSRVDVGFHPGPRAQLARALASKLPKTLKHISQYNLLDPAELMQFKTDYSLSHVTHHPEYQDERARQHQRTKDFKERRNLRLMNNRRKRKGLPPLSAIPPKETRTTRVSSHPASRPATPHPISSEPAQQHYAHPSSSANTSRGPLLSLDGLATPGALHHTERELKFSFSPPGETGKRKEVAACKYKDAQVDLDIPRSESPKHNVQQLRLYTRTMH